jgi:hypothetical protein
VTEEKHAEKILIEAWFKRRSIPTKKNLLAVSDYENSVAPVLN